MVFETLSPKMQALMKGKGFIEPTLAQKIGIPIITKGGNVLVIAPTGIGKCVSGDTIIMTEDGPEEIQNLYLKAVNTNSLDENLKTCIKQGAIIRKRKSKLYSLKTNTGKSIKVTDDHKFLALENGSLVWKELKNLSREDYIACSKKLVLGEQELSITLDMLKDHSSEITIKTEPDIKGLYLKCKSKTKLGTRRIAPLIGCHRITLTRGVRLGALGAQYVEKLAELSGTPLDEIKVNAVSCAGGRSLKVAINKDFAYFAGIFTGDGNFNRKRTLRISTSSPSILGFVKHYCNNLGLVVGKDKGHKYDYYIPSKSFYVLLNSIGISDKNKSGSVQIPKIFFKNKKLLASFLKGVFDTDGSMYGSVVELLSKSKKMIEGVSFGLLCYGIYSVIKEKYVKKYGKYYRLLIQNHNNLTAFHKNIGFGDKSKSRRLDQYVQKKKCNPNIDVIPNVSRVIKSCKNKMHIPYSRSLTTYRTMESYMYNKRNPSSLGLSNVLTMFEELSEEMPEEFNFLSTLANADILWDRIASIEFFGEGYVYDATVPETHNFIGNGIILHNTETAMLPLLDKIHIQQHKPISLLYITPLRSLNRDLLDRMYWWADKLGIDIAVRHGDTSQAERTSQREAPSHIFIITPETLQAILPGKVMKEHLKNVKYVIVDEIHELVESKRGSQLSVALERLKELAGDFQRIGLSATVGSPEAVAEFLGKDVRIIRAETNKRYDIKLESPRISVKDQALAEDLFIGGGTFARLSRIYNLITSHRSVLAFTNTRETAEVLSSRLRRLDKTLKQDVHHGSLSKERRIKSEQQFKGQELKSLIATSSLELGIDIGSIDLVIQYMSPRQVSKLIQRVGRAGHSANEVSKGIILSGDEDLFESAVIAGMAMKKQLEKVRIHEAPLDVLINQVVGILMDEYEAPEERIFNIIRRAYPFRNTTKQQFSEVIKFMESAHLLWLNAGKELSVKRSRKSFNYYFENLSTIPDRMQYRVISVIEHEPIGNLDEEFVAEHGKTGEKFIFSGRAWKVIQVEGNRVMVEPVDDIESAIPAWEGELIPVPYGVAQGVGSLRRRISEGLSESRLSRLFSVDAKAAEDMAKLIKAHKASHVVPDDRNILIEDYSNFVIIHCCGGTRANNTLSRYIGGLLAAQTGVSVNIKSDPYRIMVQAAAKKEAVADILKNAVNMEKIIESEIERSSLFKNRFLHVARRSGIIRKDVRFDKLNMNKIVAQYSGTPVYKESLREVMHDKLDLPNALSIIKRIENGGIKVHLQAGLSVLGELGLVHQFAEVMKPRMPEKEIFLAFKRRLLNTRVRLVCANCGGYSVLQTVKDIDEQPECPRCHSRLIAVVRRGQTNAGELVKKKLKKKELTKEELQTFNTIRRSSDLVIVYGKKAIECMAGRGIGPQTAARILAMLQPTKEKFYKDILHAEKEFVRTKVYWK